MTIQATSKAHGKARWANVSLGQALTMCQIIMEPKKSCLGTFHTTKVEISLSIFWRFEICNFGTIFTFNLGPINAIFEALGVLKSIWAQSSILQSTKNRIHRGSNLYVLFKNQGATRVATKWPPFRTKNIRCNFWTAYGNVHASLRSYLVPYILLIPSDMIPYHSP